MSNIEWTDTNWNDVASCVLAALSEACQRADEIAARAGCSPSAARRALHVLRTEGKAKIKGRRPTDKPSGILHAYCRRAPRRMVDLWVRA